MRLPELHNVSSFYGTPMHVPITVAEATLAPAAAQLGVHASSPVGQWPETQSWAEPGSPPTPSQLHCQQPQSLGRAQACPGGVPPGPGPPGVLLLEQEAAKPLTQSATRSRTRCGPTGRTLAERGTDGQGVYRSPVGATFVSVGGRRVAPFAPH